MRRKAGLEAENAHLRRLLAESTPCSDEIYIHAGQASTVDERRTPCAVGVTRRETGDGPPRAGADLSGSILAAITDCVSVLDLGGRLISMNAAGLALVGAACSQGTVGRPWAEFWQIAESRDAVLAALTQARAGCSCRFHAASEGGKPGEALWWDIAVTPMTDAGGQPVRILAVARDITDLKQNEARQNVLMHEMAHRMKNTLAMVQAVATQTLRNAVSLDAAGEALGARLLALSHAHDVLMQGSWSSADLHGLVDTAVALHGDGEPGRFRVDGPEVTLGPRPGLTLALILHELGTNAAKYGALSNPHGHVAITWGIAHVDGEDRLSFRWEEIGGPAVKPPTRVGFGSRLIERSLVHSFGGSARLAFPESGAVLTMDAPAVKVMVAAATQPIGII